MKPREPQETVIHMVVSRLTQTGFLKASDPVSQRMIVLHANSKSEVRAMASISHCSLVASTAGGSPRC
jgi:hypothetical protein